MSKNKQQQNPYYSSMYYDPLNIFTQHSNMTGPNNIDLAKAFAEARYNYNDNTKLAEPREKPNNSFRRNAGAIKIFANPANSSSEAIIESVISDPIPSSHNNYLTTLGHSERVGFLQALDKLINKTYPNNGEIAPPSEKFDSNKTDGIARKRQIFQNLFENASKYKQLLEKNDHRVNLWTERPPCNKRGDNCNTFLNNIMPNIEGSGVGYIVEHYDPDTTQVKDSSEKLKKGYQKYMQDNYKVPSPNNYMDDVDDDLFQGYMEKALSPNDYWGDIDEDWFPIMNESVVQQYEPTPYSPFLDIPSPPPSSPQHSISPLFGSPVVKTYDDSLNTRPTYNPQTFAYNMPLPNLEGFISDATNNMPLPNLEGFISDATNTSSNSPPKPLSQYFNSPSRLMIDTMQSSPYASQQYSPPPVISPSKIFDINTSSPKRY